MFQIAYTIIYKIGFNDNKKVIGKFVSKIGNFTNINLSTSISYLYKMLNSMII